MKQLPQASATGNIHIGTMAGKLNGVMPGHDPERLAQRVAVDPRADVLRHLALEELGRADRELHHLDPTRDLALGVGENLAVLGGDGGCERVHILLEQAQEAVEDAGAPQRGRGGPLRKGALGGGDYLVHFGPAGERDAPLCSPVAGLKTGWLRPPRPELN